MTKERFRLSPASLSRDEFIQRFGGIYEHAPWVADAVWQRGLTAEDDNISHLHQSMVDIVNNSSDAIRMKLILGHPDLAGKAALAGELTTASNDEQASAGLDQCSAAELNRFTDLNTRYKQAFGFPFIKAVRHSNRHEILAAFEQRLTHNRDQEIDCAMREIHNIALFRLQEL